MLQQIGEPTSAKIGSKAKALTELKNAGFDIPNGFVLSADIYDELLKYNHIGQKIEYELSDCNESNLKSASQHLMSFFKDFVFPEELVNEIEKAVGKEKKYAVRSSALKEDLKDFSFAGQYVTHLNVCGTDEIIDAIIECYESIFSENVLYYFLDNKLSLNDLQMPVIVQEMVAADISGVAFTANPFTGNDKEILIEALQGLGENLVGGKANPERYHYNWFLEQYEYNDGNKILSKNDLKILTDTLLEIQLFFGRPTDVEFAFNNERKLYILQARPITKIKYSGIKHEWTTANFKDGVSTSTCFPFMWSLYEFIWEAAFRKFLIDSKLLAPKELGRLGNMFFSRPYWDLSVAKKAMSKIPGYKERDFDSDLGVKITYDGDGETTNLSPKSIFKTIRVVLAQKKIFKNQSAKLDSFKRNFTEKYQQYIDNSHNDYDYNAIERLWYNLIKTVYFESESTYFRQIFVNTVYQAHIKNSLLKHITQSDYLNLISGLSEVSHLLPLYDLWEISRKIRTDAETQRFWRGDIETIKQAVESQNDEYYLPLFRAHIKKFGYHSDKELDVSYKCYFEEVDPVIKMLKETVNLPDEGNPVLENEMSNYKYKLQLQKLQNDVSKNVYQKFYKNIEKMRKLLWWREELKDISSRFYYVIRIYTMKLAKAYRERGILSEIDDIWYLRISDIFDFIDGKITDNDLINSLDKNKKYYYSFRNYLSENEIGSVYDREGKNTTTSSAIKGISCNNKTVTGTARVASSLDEIDRLEQGDILITRFTDTGWTSKFSKLGGIVTEYGGILCHAAIVSREYDIACIVCVKDCMETIKDGSNITINGTTGEIFFNNN